MASEPPLVRIGYEMEVFAPKDRPLNAGLGLEGFGQLGSPDAAVKAPGQGALT